MVEQRGLTGKVHRLALPEAVCLFGSIPGDRKVGRQRDGQDGDSPAAEPRVCLVDVGAQRLRHDPTREVRRGEAKCLRRERESRWHAVLGGEAAEARCFAADAQRVVGVRLTQPGDHRQVGNEGAEGCVRILITSGTGREAARRGRVWSIPQW